MCIYTGHKAILRGCAEGDGAKDGKCHYEQQLPADITLPGIDIPDVPSDADYKYCFCKTKLCNSEFVLYTIPVDNGTRETLLPGAHFAFSELVS